MIIQDILVLAIFVLAVVVDIILHIRKKQEGLLHKVVFLPVLVSVIHFIFLENNVFMYTVYGASLLLALQYFRKKRKIFYYVTEFFACILAFIPLVLTIITNSNCYSSLNYVDSFKKFHEDMKQEYALQGWKETDFDQIYTKYYPMFEEAESKQDKNAYVNALLSYMAAYEDGHVQLWDMYENFGIGSTGNLQNVDKELLSNYYGMSLMKLDTGEFVAVNVEKGGSADLAGIKDGTVITSWNGSTVIEQLNKIERVILAHCRMFADRENRERFKPFLLSCMGGDKVEVAYLGDQGKEQSTSLESMGNGYEYFYDTIGKFLQKDIRNQEEPDIRYETLENHIGCLKVYGMGSDFDGIRSQMNEYLKQMENDKVTALIVDARNNIGGDDRAGALLAEYFTEGNSVYLKETTYEPESNQYKINQTLEVKGNGRIKMPVMLLVNSQCISAGEGFVYNMAKFENVTVAGISGTNGSFGTIDGIDIMPEGMMAVYPSIACVDEDGVVMIDSKKDGIGGIKPDITIPVDRDAVGFIFDEKCDYELEYACGRLNYIKSHPKGVMCR